MKNKQQWREYGYKVIFASKYPRQKVEKVLDDHIEEAIAELGGSFAVGKGKIKSYFLEMSHKEMRDSIDDIYK